MKRKRWVVGIEFVLAVALLFVVVRFAFPRIWVYLDSQERPRWKKAFESVQSGTTVSQVTALFGPLSPLDKTANSRRLAGPAARPASYLSLEAPNAWVYEFWFDANGRLTRKSHWLDASHPRWDRWRRGGKYSAISLRIWPREE